VLMTIHGVWGAGLVAGLGGLARRSLLGRPGAEPRGSPR
jgi:hypothetical protein